MEAPSGTVRDWLDRHAQARGDETSHGFVDQDMRFTWSGLRHHACAGASMLSAAGMKPGDTVALMCPNGPEAVLAFFAVTYAGGIATMINLVAGADAVAYALDHSRAKLAFIHDDAMDLFKAANVKGMTRLNPGDLLTPDHEFATHLPELRADDPALLMYTSGTTGKPKGVLHTHASLLAGGWTTAVAHALQPQDRALCVLPLYHINGLCVTLMAPLVSGGSVFVAPRFSASKFWQWCADHGLTWFSVVPTIISHLLHGAEEPSNGGRQNLRFGRSASSALAPEVQTAFETRFGVPIIETMGLTETAAQILSNPLPPMTRKVGSPGQAIGNDVAILNPDQSQAPINVQGEIAVRGPNVMAKYLHNPEATKETFNRDGWLLTGDLGHIDQDGFVFVTGRKKELIIKGGENIAPREIDEALYSHKAVIEAAAFARPCTTYGERVEAAVTLEVGADVSAQDLIALCVQRLGKFKSPDCIHILDDLPKGPSGKIQRLKLKDLTRNSP